MHNDGTRIEEPRGPLGVLLVGLGAVSSTFIAGVELIKKGLGTPIGSLTQMGTIRLGKRTEQRTPRIRDFVPLASLDSLRFAAWDIFEDNAYQAAVRAGVLEQPMLEQVSSELEAIAPMRGVFDPAYVGIDFTHRWAKCRLRRMNGRLDDPGVNKNGGRFRPPAAGG